MSDSLKVLACKSCLRDNPGPGVFSSPENIQKEYQEKLKEGWLRKTANFELQSCFAECEHFHCLRVYQGNKGFHLKQISSPEKIEHLVAWLRGVKAGEAFEVPENLKDHLLYPLKD